MEKFVFEDRTFYTTKEEENLTEAQISCSKNSSTIANLSGVNFKKFVEKLFIYRNSNLDNFFQFLRVHSAKSSQNDCYGLLDLAWLNVDEDLSENVEEICVGDRDFVRGKYKTLCSRKFDKINVLSDNSCEPGTPVVLWIISIVIVSVIGASVIGFCYFKNKKQKRLIQKISARQNELLGSTNEVSNYYQFTNVQSTKIYVTN